jgi:hypothetical protein
LVTGLIGAGVGLVVNLGVQTIPQIVAGKTVGEAFEQVDWGNAAGAAVAGGLMGLTMGIAAPTLGSAVIMGSIGSGVGRQASALTEATCDEIVYMMNGSGFDGERFFQTARECGFLNLAK